MTFTPSFLNEIRSKISAHSVVSRTVRLSKSGKNWTGCCPFHDESTPSFYVYDDGFHCFGCGAHGDIFAFLVMKEGYSFVDAVKRLCDQVGLVVPRITRLDASAAKNSAFNKGQIEAILGTAAKMLVCEGRRTEASILANGDSSLSYFSHDDWDGGQDYWTLHIAVATDTYLEFEDRGALEEAIAKTIALPLRTASDSDFIRVSITTALEDHPDWRRRTQEHLTGKGITNQGRVRSDNVAPIEHKGLRFRSRPELYFQLAMGSTGLSFAPLPVVVVGGLNPRRIEPDFVIWSQGVTMLVEIDGDNFHSEKPVEAHARLKFLLDEGVILERITASECDTEEKARHAAARVVETIKKRKAAH